MKSSARFGSLVEKIDERLGASSVSLPLLSVSQTLGVVRFGELHDRPPRADSFETYKLVQPGDVVFNKMSIRSGAMGVANEPGLVTYHYEVLRPRAGVDPRYVVALMKSGEFTAELIRNERGIGAGGAAGVRTTEVPFSVMKTFRVSKVDAEDQAKLANYLDRETAEIDAFIADLDELGELTERRALAEIEEKFDALGPATIPIKRLGLRKESGVSVNGAPFSADAGRPGVLKTGAVSSGKFKPHENKAVLETSEVQKLSAPVREGAVIVNRGNAPDLVGSAAYVDRPVGNLYLSDLLWQLTGDRVDTAFLAAWTKTARYRAAIHGIRVGTSASMQKVSYENFVSLEIPRASRKEKQQVVESIVGLTDAVEATQSSVNQARSLAKERRAALISAAVTGQLDVTNL